MKRILKRLGLWLLLGVFLMGTAPAAVAETSYGDPNWQVTFTDRLETNFKSSDITDVFGELLPGDNAIVTVKLQNKNVNSTDWYMRNNVLKSLEDDNSVASGGSYSYKLTYTNNSGVATVLYDSEKVGGENNNPAGEGLHGATNSLKDYFYLDSLKTNESGSVTLEVVLEGEGQTNDFQNTIAKLQMDFAVELNTPETSRRTNTTTTTSVRTGDETDLLPLYAAMGVSGMVLLVLGIVIYKKDKKRGGE